MSARLATRPLALKSSVDHPLPTSRTEVRPSFKTSKEWIVPPRPKPGRKPAVLVEDNDSSRKAHNRASQRAFRERKQEYVGELEEKVRQLEQGEGEKAKFFQQKWQKATEEIVALKAENENLRKSVEELKSGKLRPSEAASPLSDDSQYAARQTSKQATREYCDEPASKRSRRSLPASGRRDSSAIDPSIENPATSPPPSLPSTSSFIPPNPPVEQQSSPGEPSCGFCTNETSCFCSDVGYHIDHSKSDPPEPLANEEQIQIKEEIEPSSTVASVPLNLRKTRGSKIAVWKLENDPVASTSRTVVCSGDPANCPACQDDPFGKAFCKSLSNSACAATTCANCPSKAEERRREQKGKFIADLKTQPTTKTSNTDSSLFDALVDLPCCGDPALCGSLSCGPGVQNEVLLPRSVPIGTRSSESVPCNEAWTALKCHPNIAFADLQMLADVVAKRTRCDGPISIPALPQASAEIAQPLPGISPVDSPKGMGEGNVGFSLVPHQELVCAADAGTRKRLTVERGAVREALELLDRAGRG